MDRPPEINRYHRQMLLPGVGELGQQRLAKSRAVIVGCGALGCQVADLLTRAGVGRLTIVDRDLVELTNLQRQCLFDERDAAEAMPKAEAARRRLAAINSQITIDARIADLTPANAESLVLDEGRPPGVLIDGTDNFETRLLLNDLAVKHGIPFVYAGVVATRATAAVIRPGITRCLRCLMPELPPPGSVPTCDTVGVFGPAVTIVAGYQASEALKLLLGADDRVMSTMLGFDLWAGTRQRIELGEPEPGCACCGLGRFEYLDAERGSQPVSLCGQNAWQIAGSSSGSVDLESLLARLAPLGRFDANRFCVRGELTEGAVGLTVFKDGRAIVAGVSSPEQARSIHARFIGA